MQKVTLTLLTSVRKSKNNKIKKNIMIYSLVHISIVVFTV